MFKKILYLFNSQEKKIKKKILIQQLVLIISNLLETLTILSIMPVVSIFLDPEIIRNIDYFQNIPFFNTLDNHSLIIYVGGSCLFLQIFSAAISSYAQFLNLEVTSHIGNAISRNIFNHYINKNTIFFSEVAPSEITKIITFEVPRIIDKIIGPFFRLVTKIILIFFIFISLILVSYKVTLISFFVMIVYYYFVLKFIKKKISAIDKGLSSSQGILHKICNEGFNFIKEIKILKKENFFFNKYLMSSSIFYKDLAKLPFYGTIPRLILDYFFFISITLVLIIINLNNENQSVQSLIIHIAFYAVCAPKLIPAFQSIYYEFINMKSASTSLDLLSKILIDDKDFFKNKKKHYDLEIDFKKEIKLENISFSYKPKKIKVLNNINLTFLKNQSYAIIGETGIGKSTIGDLLCGFIEPSAGNIIIDNISFDNKYLNNWQKKISLVKQNFYALDDTILTNIVFDEINYDHAKLKNAVKLSGMENFISTLPEGLNYRVGDNASKLSGGQKQRLALARTLYHLKEILILDEATSALDPEMENKVIDNILNFKNLTTILITHNHNLAKKMKNIYIFNGKEFTKD